MPMNMSSISCTTRLSGWIAPALRRPARQRHVDRFRRKPALDLLSCERRCLSSIGRLDRLPDLVGDLADDRPLFRGKSAHAAQNLGQRAFFAEKFHAHLLQLGSGLNAGKLLFRRFAQLFQPFFHLAFHAFLP